MKKIGIVFISLILLIAVACSNSNVSEDDNTDEWEKSSVFSIKVDGVEKEEEFIGIEEKVGISSMEFTKNTDSKFLLFFWDKEVELRGKNLKVEAQSKDTGNKFLITEVESLSGAAPDYQDATASAHMITNFPNEGLWKIKMYLDDRLYESIVINVK